jgi:ParB/RepB/Spo0J family partition protein
METQTLIPIDLIDPNPYQPRHTMDPEAVAELAANIKRNSLLQIPSARQVNGRYQLAFGHRRLAAVRLNGEDCMPLIIRDLDDQQMFEMGVAENIKRRDLNPIEQAEAMDRYMTEFNKTSVEAGEFFNASPEKVRSTVRLLKLPKGLQSGVADGTITQTNARRLLTIQRVAPQEVKEVARQLKEKPGIDPDAIIADTLKDTGNSVEMWPSWRRDDEPMAGAHLWPLRLPADKFPKSYLPELKASSLSKFLLIEHPKDELQKWIDWLRMGFIHGPMAPSDKERDESVSDYLIRKGAPAEVVESIAHLVNPPACSACPFYARVSGAHFCTFKECYNRKVRAWQANELEKAIQALGIAAYDHKVDGAYETLASYKEAHKKLVDKRSPDLRLKKGSTYSNFEGVPDGFAIVAVGKSGEALKKAEQARDIGRGGQDESYHTEQRRLAKVREANREAAYSFLWNVGTPAFAGLLETVVNLPFLKEFADRMVRGVPVEEPDPKAKKADRLDFYRRALLFSLLDDVLDMWDISQKKKPVTAMAKHLQGIATTWGVKLPKTWLDQAAQADKAITVTAVTES